MDSVLPENSQVRGFESSGRRSREGGVGIGWEYGGWVSGAVGRLDDSIGKLICTIIIPTH